MVSADAIAARTALVSRLGVQGLGFWGIRGTALRREGLGFRIQGFGSGPGFQVEYSGFRLRN